LLNKIENGSENGLLLHNNGMLQKALIAVLQDSHAPFPDKLSKWRIPQVNSFWTTIQKRAGVRPAL
jgi:hypothetical protein